MANLTLSLDLVVADFMESCDLRVEGVSTVGYDAE